MITKAPAGLPRRREVIAAVAAVALLMQLVLAQLTLAVAALFVIVGRLSRWRRSWLLAPVAVGLVWALLAGQGMVIEGFAAGPAQVLGYFGHGSVFDRLGHPLAAFTRPWTWLPRQLPLALLTGAAEAAAIDWLARCRPGRQVPAPRPGAAAALRGAVAVRMIRAGAVLTRNGCALGVVRATGAVAELRWTEIAGGAVVTGPVATEVTVTCLQLVHAALRRRKPLIVVDPGGDGAIAQAVATACDATGTPLRLAGGGEAAVDLVRVVSERLAVLLPVSSPELADLACADIAALAAQLGRIGVDGDCLVWVTRGESLPGQALGRLIPDGSAAGLAVLVGVTSPTTMTELAEYASTVLTLAPKSLSRKPWQFSLVVRAPRRRQLQLARLVPARLPPVRPARLRAGAEATGRAEAMGWAGPEATA